MAYYFIFPDKDSTIYSHPDRINMNSGGDEILELVKERGTSDTNFYPSRILISFSEADLKEALELINSPGINTDFSSAKTSLQLTSIQGKNLTSTQLLEVFAVSQSWNEGTNKYLNLPSASNGVSWVNRDNSIEATKWATSSFSPATTGSIKSGSIITEGGGVWYTGSGYQTSQQFLNGNSLDTDFDVTDIVTKFSQSLVDSATGINNNGFLIKQIDSVESNVSTSFGELQYFSSDTHTIYPPSLVFKFNDAVNQTQQYDTGSIAKSGSIHVSMYNNKPEYNQNEIGRFRFQVRNKYPVRTFATSSNFITNLRFKGGENTLYSIRDANTEREIIPFDKEYTQLSHDKESSYLDIYMNGLQPERYYRILVKHTNSDGTTVYDNDYTFKVVR
tara:strand:- start:779 stop:1948 length:1170 start_codon:yes stop_codon:yes gene_type:complete